MRVSRYCGAMPREANRSAVDMLVVHLRRALRVLVCCRARFGSRAARQRGNVCRIPVDELHLPVGREDHVLGFEVAVGALRMQKPQRGAVEGAGRDRDSLMSIRIA